MFPASLSPAGLSYHRQGGWLAHGSCCSQPSTRSLLASFSRSPHTITAVAGLALLLANGVLGNVMQGARWPWNTAACIHLLLRCRQ